MVGRATSVAVGRPVDHIDRGAIDLHRHTGHPGKKGGKGGEFARAVRGLRAFIAPGGWWFQDVSTSLAKQNEWGSVIPSTGGEYQQFIQSCHC